MTKRRHWVTDMLHLDAESLAALADRDPSAIEAEHLAVCALCAREAAVHRGVRAASARAGEAVLDAPLTSWATLAPALREAGLLQEGAGGAGAGRLASFRLKPWLQVAAALVIAAGGIALGRFTAAPAGVSTVASGATGSGSSGTSLLTGNRPITTSDGTPITSLTTALQVMQRAERDYRVAAAFITANDSSYGRNDVDRYRTRMAALDKVNGAALEAVNASPNDPVLNQYLLSVRSARDVTLQQLGNSLPAGTRLASY
jgi:hypothetical protein